MKESVKTFCRINGVEVSKSLTETLFEAYMESVANDDREHPTEFNNAGDKEYAGRTRDSQGDSEARV